MLRALVEELVKATPEYLEKERVRQLLQDVVVSHVRDGSVSDDAKLKELFRTISMAARALQAVPFEVYKKMSEQ